MGSEYTVNIQSDAGSADNVWIELTAASGIEVSVKKINACKIDTSSDTLGCRLKVSRTSSAATNTGAGTVVEMQPSGASATTTAAVKQAGVFAGIGTVVDKIMDTNFNLRQTFEWVARSRDNYLRSEAGGRLTFQLLTNVSGGNLVISVFFIEY